MKPNDRSDYLIDEGSAVPKFGEWDVSDPASANGYNYIFNQVREEKHSGSTKISSISECPEELINPNDPLQNPEAFHQDDPPIHTYPSQAPCSQVSTRVKHERHKSREDVDVNRDVKYMSTENLATHKHVSSSPNRHHDQGNLDYPLRKPNHSNDELEHSIERFPIQAKVPFLLLQEKGDPHQISMIDEGSAVPKFGEWDVSDPASANGYNYIFNQIVNGPEVLSKYVGETVKNLRDLFADAEQEQRARDEFDGNNIVFYIIVSSHLICIQVIKVTNKSSYLMELMLFVRDILMMIVFLYCFYEDSQQWAQSWDEPNTRGSTRDGTDFKNAIVKQLLTKLEALNNALLIVTTNMRDLLNKALLRFGRLEILVEFNIPDEIGRLQVQQIHLNKMK
ncbi:hypothetical protein M5K25_005233 [Dendrobium thyrsiflorum]|uniref:Vesicle-fusing ATPase n=1 Tax=Dendrobium thyrsiflorum TaxID=117978 RepID=A0ABD0VHF5_DENTH